MNMNTRQNQKSVSSIEQQISSINMPEYQRNQVLHQARIAEAFVDVFMWAGSKLSRPAAGVFAKPSPKY
jgi:hypothetical protein